MTGMINYSLTMLENLPKFLMSEPIIYIFGTVIAAAIVGVIIKIVKM